MGVWPELAHTLERRELTLEVWRWRDGGCILGYRVGREVGAEAG